MEKVTLELPQLILVSKTGSNRKYLERIAGEANMPKVNLTFQEDSKEDPRIITIKYQIYGEENNHVLYYSENFDNYGLITANLGYNYIGLAIVKDKNNYNIGFNFEHLSKEGIRLKHIHKINERDDIKENLTPEYVSKRYKDLFNNLPKYP